MKIIKITKQSITEAVRILRRGGTVVYPTETAYALSCDFMNAAAKRKIFKIKNRPKEKNLPAICASKKQVEQFFKLPPLAWEIWKKYWPKPVSIILKCRIGNKKQEIPVRISSNKTARDLARKLGKPIIATSANVSGKPANYSAKEIAEIFSRRKHQPDLILDGGVLPERPVSTIIKIKNSNPIVVRQGEVKI